MSAKITESAQPLDLGPFFKMLKVTGRQMTYTGHVIPLKLLVDYIFYYLTKDKQLILSIIKYNVLKDMICNAPQIFDVTFNIKMMINDVVESGMLDKRAKLFPNMFGLNKQFQS